MSKITWRGAIVAAQYPMLYRHAQRSVLNPGFDAQSAPDPVAQLIFCENVMPTSKGAIAVAMQRVVASVGGTTVFDNLFTLRGPEDEVILFSPANGENRWYNNSTQGWGTASADLNLDTTQYPVSTSYVNGRSFVLYATQFIGEYDFSTNTLASVTPTYPAGVTIADVVAICGASNYNLFFTKNRVLWSTPNDPLEFANLLIGAGNSIPIDLRGTIVGAAAIGGGFVIYTTEGAVAAFFTNDATVPFRFVGIDNSGGVTSMQRVASDANISGHFTFGSGGFQNVTLQGASGQWPEATDFISGKEFEQWNKTTKSVEYSQVIGLDCALVFLASRYVIISYGLKDESFSHALVFDTLLKKWGKLRVDHVDVAMAVPGIEFNATSYDELILGYDEYVGPYSGFLGSAQGALPNASTFLFVNANGATRIMTFNASNSLTGAESVMVLGRYQVTRDNMVTWQRAQLDGASEDTNCFLLPSFNGWERDTFVTPMKLEDGKWGGQKTCQNFDLAFTSAFDASNLIIEAKQHGKR